VRVDPRAGSGPLLPLLQRRGVKGAESAQLSYGDISITGNGPGGCPVQVGIEYKKLSDLIQCIDNGRLVGHQLPGMLECYDQVWVLVEGIWREGKSGMVEVPRGSGWRPIVAGSGGFMSTALQGFLLTLQIKLNVRVAFTGTSLQTVDWLYHLNRWWVMKEWEEHRAHLAFDNSAALTLISRPTLVRRVAKELPGVGWERSAAVARRFGSVLDMAVADTGEWESIEGIGKVTARKVVRALAGEDRG
jgi:ERCC4-type nuclease